MVLSDTETLVCEDIKKRQQVGIRKYQTTVASNPLELRWWLQHQYEELLDAAVYTKRAIQELEKNENIDRLNAVMRSWAEEAMDNNGDNSS